MRQALLRCTILVAVVMLVCASNTSYGRGPGGRGGQAGGRAGGGQGGRGLELSKRDVKKNDGPNLNANGGLNAAVSNFQGAQGKLSIGDGKAATKWQTRSGEMPNTAQNAVNNFQNGPRPFTAEWYANHPAAWQSTHPHADAWAAATATGVAAWLGWAAYPASDVDGIYNTTVVYEQAPAEETEAVPAADDDQAATSQEDASDWLALGVYSVLSSSGEPAARLLQLSVNRNGELRGVYYDAISNNSQNLSGQIDQSTQVAQWSIDANPQTTFRTNLDQLTQPSGTIQVNQPGGEQQWRIARQQEAS